MKAIDKFKKIARKGFFGFDHCLIVKINNHMFIYFDVINKVTYTIDDLLEDYLTVAAAMKIIKGLQND